MLMNKLTIFALLLFGLPAWAESLVLPLSTHYQQLQQQQGLSVSIQSSSRMGHDIDEKLNNYSELGFQAYGKTYDINLSFVPEEESMPYIDAPEAYYEVSKSIQVGRKLHSWNRLDEVFSLSVMQPVFKKNLALPKQQGLTGLWWDFGGVQLYTSVIHVPEMGPYFEQKNGTLYSKNPWFKRPVSSVEFQEKETPVGYKLNIPPAEQIALKPAIGFQTTAPLTKKSEIKVAAVYKPMNQIHIELSSPEFVITPEKINVNVYPKVVHHAVLSGQWDYRFSKNLKTYMSYMYDQPDSNDVPSDWEQAVLYRSQIYGAGVEYNYKNLQLGAHYFQRQDEFPEREEKEIEADVSSSFDRFPYKSAALVMAGLNFINWNWQLKWQSSKDFNNSLVYLKGTYRLNQRLNLFADALVIGGPEGFYSQYRENDFISLGAQYVF